MADPTIADYTAYYTGGSANSSTALSIGGAISSTRILNQSTTGLLLVTGVTINDSYGNAVGAGSLLYTLTGQTLTWTPYGGSAGTAVAITADGRYFIQGAGVGAGGLCVTIAFASLPSSNQTDTITVANITNTMFADVTKAQSLAGITNYLCIAVKNNHATMPMTSILEWVAANTTGQDHITIGLDPAVAGTGASGYPTAIANQNTAPAGVTFVAPVSFADTAVLALGTLTAGQVRFLWFKQAVPAGVTIATLADTFSRGFSITA